MKMRDGYWIFLVGVIVMMAGPTLTEAQVPYGSGGVPPQEPSAAGSPEWAAYVGAGGPFRIIPTMTVSERYDSNILAFRSLGGAGRQQWDFVTDVSPGARATHSNSFMDGTLTGQAIASFYVNNPGLNYVGAQGNFTTVLDKMSERMVRGLGLRVSGTVLYYPEQPAFVSPQSQLTDLFRGIQARRNNAISNATTVQSSYMVNPLVQLTSSYSFQTMRFIGQNNYGDTGQPLPLFDLTTHGATAGANYLVVQDHTVGVGYSYRQTSFGSGTADSVIGRRSFAVHGVNATWSWTFARDWRARVSPGLSLATQVPDRLFWTINAGLTWTGQQTSATVSFTRALHPSFFGEAALLASNVVSGSLSYRLSSTWEMTVGANYAVNTRSGTGLGSTSLRFESIGVNGSVRYSVYRGITAALTGSHNDFTFEQPGTTFRYDRQVGMLTLTAEWN
ncbi:MAG: hypothetical protein K2Q17_18055 [Nitrospiraceae bacterium]|nr:hypothetical protein [Nitrospiraceae bacterium]OQW32133.1 MAG: hypothetical protein A4E20_03150 [Nitrospira sp. SG-bin2]